MVGMLPYFTQHYISMHLVKDVCVLACHPLEQTSLIVKIPLSPDNSPTSLTGTLFDFPQEVLWG
jgi:hypothetical protein